MKSKSILFFIYCAIMILSLVALLVFRIIEVNKDNSAPPSDSATDLVPTPEDTPDDPIVPDTPPNGDDVGDLVVPENPLPEEPENNPNDNGDINNEDKEDEDLDNGNVEDEDKDDTNNNIDNDNNDNVEDGEPSLPPEETPPIEEPTSPDEDDIDEDINEPVEETIYATDLILNHTGEIHISVGEKVRILEGIVTVVPSSMRELLHYSITPRYNSDPSKISFNGETLIAEKAGQYNLVYTVKNTDSKYLEEKIVIIVNEDPYEKITQNIFNMRIDESLNLDDTFTMNLPNEFVRISTNDIISMEGNKIVATSIGLGKIEINYTYMNIERIYSFEIEIISAPKYYLEISYDGDTAVADLENRVVEIDTSVGIFTFSCCVIDENGVGVEQDIEVELSNSNAMIITAMGELFVINCTKKGIVEITITASSINLDAIIKLNIQ